MLILTQKFTGTKQGHVLCAHQVPFLSMFFLRCSRGCVWSEPIAQRYLSESSPLVRRTLQEWCGILSAPTLLLRACPYTPVLV